MGGFPGGGTFLRADLCLVTAPSQGRGDKGESTCLSFQWAIIPAVIEPRSQEGMWRACVPLSTPGQELHGQQSPCMAPGLRLKRDRELIPLWVLSTAFPD